MKTVAIFLGAFCFVFCTLVRADDDETLNSCLRKEGVTIAELPGLLHDQSDEGIKRRGCLEACYFQKLGLMTENNINLDNIDAYLDKVLADSEGKEEVRKSVHDCAAKAVPNDDPCVVAQKFAACEFEQIQLGVREMIKRFSV